MANPVDTVRDACVLLAGYLPVLERTAPEPDDAAFAAPGMTARPPAAPLPGNAAAIYALTSIWASARWAEDLLLYAAGAARRQERRGGSDANTALLLTEVIPKLFAVIEGDRDLERLVISELDARLADTESLAAIDVAQRWRPLPKRPCPYCGGCWLRVLLDHAGRSAGHVECFTVGCRDGGGLRPAAQATTDERGVPGLAWADGRWEPAPDLED